MGLHRERFVAGKAKRHAVTTGCAELDVELTLACAAVVLLRVLALVVDAVRIENGYRTTRCGGRRDHAIQFLLATDNVEGGRTVERVIRVRLIGNDPVSTRNS